VAPVPATSIPGVAPKLPVCLPIAAGEFEPARNLSLITSLVNTTTYPNATADMLGYASRTVLDPRYSPTGGLFKHASTAFVLNGSSIVSQPPYASPGGDLRNP